MIICAFIWICVTCACIPSQEESKAPLQIAMNPIGHFDSGLSGDEGALEIADYHAATKRCFVTSGTCEIRILDMADPGRIELLDKIDLSRWGGNATSVKVVGDQLAAAVCGRKSQDDGHALIFDLDGGLLKEFRVGAHPDMITCTPDKTKILVACEGEPDAAFENDPEGSICIIDIHDGLKQAKVRKLDFRRFNDDCPEEIRISTKAASVAHDLEPEYIAVSPDSNWAWITLQENNALALVSLKNEIIVSLVPLGYKDHSKEGFGLDPSNNDGGINIATWPVRGLYMPDAIAAFSVADSTYLITANEGDSREYGDKEKKTYWTDEARVKDVRLDPEAFPNAKKLQKKSKLGSLKCVTTEGDIDGDGDFDFLYSFGARSFSIWDNTGRLVWDSGDDFARRTSALVPDLFNTNEDKTKADSRSDDKGCEPESVVVGDCYGRKVAFIALERTGSIMAYDVTDPTKPTFLHHVNPRADAAHEKNEASVDLSPEGLVFVRREDSPTGTPLLIAVFEVSGTIRIYEIVSAR